MKKKLLITICFVLLANAGSVYAADNPKDPVLHFRVSYVHKWTLQESKFTGPSPFQSASDNPFILGSWNYENEWFSEKRTMSFEDRKFDRDSSPGFRLEVLFPVISTKAFELSLGPDFSWAGFQGRKNTVPTTVTNRINLSGHWVEMLSLRDSRREGYDLDLYQGTVKVEALFKPAKWLRIGAGAGATLNYFNGSLEINESVRLSVFGTDVSSRLAEYGLGPTYRERASISQFEPGACAYALVVVKIWGPFSVFAGGRYDYIPEFSKRIGPEKFTGRFSTVEASGGITAGF